MKKEYPRGFVFKEKHGDLYYLVQNEEELNKMWLQVLKDRHQQGYYNWMKDYVPYGLKVPKYTQEEILALPPSMTEEQQKMMLELKKYNASIKEQNNTRNDFIQIEKTLSTNNGKLAYLCLQNFSNGEYEGFEEIGFQKID